MNILLVSLSFLVLFAPQQSRAKINYDNPSETDCRFYLHLEDQLQCAAKGKDGSEYLPVYGYKYCNRFSSTAKEDKWEQEAARWVRGTTLCLQKSIATQGEGILPCTHMETEAFDSHPRCYHEKGICNLKLGQELKIIWVAWNFDLAENAKQSTTQFFKTVGACGRDWTNAMFSLLGRVISKSKDFNKSQRDKAVAIMDNLPKSEKYLAKYFNWALSSNLFGGTNQNQLAAAKFYSGLFSKSVMVVNQAKLQNQLKCLTAKGGVGCSEFNVAIEKSDEPQVVFMKKNVRNEVSENDLDSILKIKEQVLHEENYSAK